MRRGGMFASYNQHYAIKHTAIEFHLSRKSTKGVSIAFKFVAG